MTHPDLLALHEHISLLRDYPRSMNNLKKILYFDLKHHLPDRNDTDSLVDRAFADSANEGTIGQTYFEAWITDEPHLSVADFTNYIIFRYVDGNGEQP